jgi:hypothetical protein
MVERDSYWLIENQAGLSNLQASDPQLSIEH